MSARVKPLDPHSPKGIEVADRMTIILTEIHEAVQARRAARKAV